MEYIPYVVIALVLIGGAIATFYNERKSVQSWLILAVTEAEKALGGGVGVLKLRACFEQFVKLFPVFSKIITFEVFSKWVDKALIEMKKMLKNNIKAAEYVGVPQKDDNRDQDPDNQEGVVNDEAHPEK